LKVVITGEPGIGKTTVVRRVVERLGHDAEGFWTQEVRDKRSRKRIGFKVVTTEGNEALFASKKFTSKNLVGSYGVNVKRFEEVALPVLEKALRSEGSVAVVDEVGRMELFSKRFRELVEILMGRRDKDAIFTIPVRDVHPLVARLRRLEGAVLIEVDLENRDALAEDIVGLFKGAS